MLLYGAELRRRARAKADVIEAVSAGYAGCKSKEGSRATQKLIAALRRD